MLAFDLAWSASLGALLPTRLGAALMLPYAASCAVSAAAWPDWQLHSALEPTPAALAATFPALAAAFALGTRLPRRALIALWLAVPLTMGDLFVGMDAARAGFLVASGAVNGGALTWALRRAGPPARRTTAAAPRGRSPERGGKTTRQQNVRPISAPSTIQPDPLKPTP